MARQTETTITVKLRLTDARALVRWVSEDESVQLHDIDPKACWDEIEEAVRQGLDEAGEGRDEDDPYPDRVMVNAKGEPFYEP